MRTLIILLCFTACLMACNNSGKEKDDFSAENDSKEFKNDPGSSIQDQHIVAEEKKKTEIDRTENSNSATAIPGTYFNTEHQEDTSCKCYCLEVATNGTSELCLKENEMYINARFQQDGNNINIFYNGRTAKTTAEKIPWEKFETGMPIAVLSPETNGDLKLDWKGFRIDGEIAIDYALLGKKTLEGTYKKK
ncbi:hypothetical protein [Christiangramia sabulilitoris]|uniref:Uncharacterized protein n=1 Tax=Christiangramia sabulilitoris TaxID=2583991 RepID=A0A550I3N3_9FLAO|nr:hypothetical protein [Christiangramia sabulilitoris]TRO65576.1 hypothetical protein FGM01_09260 [Christiangramia sabulilitoris]